VRFRPFEILRSAHACDEDPSNGRTPHGPGRALRRTIHRVEAQVDQGPVRLPAAHIAHQLGLPLTPEVDDAKRAPMASLTQKWPHRAGDNHGVGLRFGCDASGHVHGISPEIEHEAALAHDAGDNRGAAC
jgi:hypothetical protein